MTNRSSFTVNACEGRRADTVPAILRVCRILVEPVRFFESSCSSFFRIAWFPLAIVGTQTNGSHV